MFVLLAGPAVEAAEHHSAATSAVIQSCTSTCVEPVLNRLSYVHVLAIAYKGDCSVCEVKQFLLREQRFQLIAAQKSIQTSSPTNDYVRRTNPVFRPTMLHTRVRREAVSCFVL